MTVESNSLSLSAYARHRNAMGLPGGSLKAVQVAIQGGRLRACITPDKRIRDAQEADAEWLLNTRADMVPHTGPTSCGGVVDPPALGESKARKEAALAELAEIELAEKRGELVKAKDVESKLADTFSACKTKLLGIAARVRQRDPSLTSVQIALIETLVREALDDLAG
jgi:hypothetical protein